MMEGGDGDTVRAILGQCGARGGRGGGVEGPVVTMGTGGQCGKVAMMGDNWAWGQRGWGRPWGTVGGNKGGEAMGVRG